MLIDTNKIRREQTELKNEMKALCEGALTRSDKKMTDSEQEKYNSLEKRVKEMDSEITQAEQNNQREFEGGLPAGHFDGRSEEQTRSYGIKELRSYTDSVKNSNPLPEGMRSENLSLSKAVRGLVTGRWDGAEMEERVMSTGSNSAGGYTVPAPLASNVIALAMNKMVSMRAGARLVPMTSKTLVTPRLEGTPTAAWVAENGQGSFSDCTFGAVTLTAKKLMALTSMSLELFEDGQNIGSIVEDALSSALALEFDRVALIGSASGAEPRGVINDSNIQTFAHTNGIDATLVDFSPFSLAIEKIQNENETPNAIIINPKLAGVVDRLKDTTNQPLNPPESWKQTPKFVTKQIPFNLGTGTNETVALIGDFSQLLIGMRSEISLLISQQAGDAFDHAQVYIRAILRGDVAVARPKAFCKITGILYEVPAGD